MAETAVADPVTNVIEALSPFRPDDGHKGTFLLLRIAGLEQATALRLIQRKTRTLNEWRIVDADFARIDNMVSILSKRFGGEARVMRTALLDVSIVEAGIIIFRKVLTKQKMTEGEWTYATRMAGLRVPMMGAREEAGSPWERLANAIKTTLGQAEPIGVQRVALTMIEQPDGTKSVIAEETSLTPNPEQQQVVNEIVRKMMDKANGNDN